MFKPKDCFDCYLKGGPQHRYPFRWGTEQPGSYSHLIELMRKADFCQVAKEEVDSAVQCLRDIPRELLGEWFVDYLEIGCPYTKENPQVTVWVTLPYPELREYGETIYRNEQLREAADKVIEKFRQG